MINRKFIQDIRRTPVGWQIRHIEYKVTTFHDLTPAQQAHIIRKLRAAYQRRARRVRVPR